MTSYFSDTFYGRIPLDIQLMLQEKERGKQKRKIIEKEGGVPTIQDSINITRKWAKIMTLTLWSFTHKPFVVWSELTI